MNYCALNCRSSLSIGKKDSGTGRCRLTAAQFKSLSINIGWIVRIALSLPDHNQEIDILCTAWPDASSNASDEDYICVDDTVQFASSSSEKDLLDLDWVECRCRVVQVYPPSSSTSVRLTLTRNPTNNSSERGTSGGNRSSSRQHHAASFSGLAVAAGVVVRAAGPRHRHAIISSVNSIGPASVISLGTIIFPIKEEVATKSQTAHTETRNSSSSSGSGGNSSSNIDNQPVSNTAVVNELMETVVYPSLYLDSKVHLRGVLLLGPPGVGKTFAVKALRTYCKDFCTIRIKELNIVEVVSAEDPIRLLKEILKPRRTPAPSSTPILGTQTPSKDRRGPSPFASYSPATPQVSSSTLTLTPSSSSSSFSSTPSSSTPMTPIGVPCTPYKWNLGPSTSKSNSKATPSTPFSSTPFSSTPFSSTPFSSPTPFFPRSQANPLTVERDDGVSTQRPMLPELTMLVIDEIDALGLPDSHSVVQAAIKQHLCDWFDRNNGSDKGAHNYCVVATTNRPSDVDPRLRRGGRLEREIEVTGCKADRFKLLLTLLNAMYSSGGGLGDVAQGGVIDFVADIIADRTGGYVAADITALVSQVSTQLREGNTKSGGNTEKSTDGGVSQGRARLTKCFELAMTVVAPSCLRGLSMKLPDLSYDDVIGCVEVKKSLRRILSFCSPAMRARVKRFGLKCPGGAILHGPPGNSKTRLILAAAADHGLPVISLSAADVYSPYVGDAEAEIRKAFRVARQASPCVLFLDELDALVTDRAGSSGSGVSVEARVLATLLVEMDGISSGGENESGGSDDNVIVMAATNRIDCIDAALLRKGRFSQTLFIPLPSEQERLLLLQYFAKRCRLSEESTEAILLSPGFNRDGLSGADIENMCREVVVASVNLRDLIKDKK